MACSTIGLYSHNYNLKDFSFSIFLRLVLLRECGTSCSSWPKVFVGLDACNFTRRVSSELQEVESDAKHRVYT